MPMQNVPALLLLHADGPNNSTVFTNSGTVVPSVAVTPRGTARITTANPKWGTGALTITDTSSLLDVTGATASQGLVLDSGDFTMEAWIYPTANAAYRTIIGRWENAQSYLLVIENGSARFWWGPYSNAFAMLVASGPAVALNQWSHIAATRQGNLWCLWLNGVLVASRTFATNAASNAGVTTTIGAYRYFVDTVAGPWAGQIDEVRVVKGQAMYSGTTYEVPTGPFSEAYAAPVTRAALEVVASDALPAPQPSMFMVTESVLLAQPLSIVASQASLEIVGTDLVVTEPAMFMVTESILIAQPTDGTVRQISLEIVGADLVSDQDVSLYSVNESVLLSLPNGKVSQATLEIVAASDFVPPTNIQQVVWFTTS